MQKPRRSQNIGAVRTWANFRCPYGTGCGVWPNRAVEPEGVIKCITVIHLICTSIGSSYRNEPFWIEILVVRACLETTRGAVFGEKAGWRGGTKENIPGGSSTEEQRSQTAFSAKTLRAAGLLSVAGVGSFLTARCGDARNSPPWPQ